MQVNVITEVDEELKIQWEKFVFEHPNGNIFQSPEYYKLILDSKILKPVVVILLDENKNIVGVLIGVIQKENIPIISYFTARCIVWGGPLVKNNNPILVKTVISKFNKELKNKVIYSQFRNIFETNAIREEFLNAGFEYIDHLDIHNNLSEGTDYILKNMNSERRHNIRRAERKELEFIELNTRENLIIAYNLIKDTYSRLRLPLYPFEVFESAFNNLAAKKILRIFAVRLKEKIISVRLVLCHKDMIYDWYAGTDDDYLKYYPNDYLPFKVMEWGAINNYKYFDFGGAGKPNVPYGVRDYKLKFGGQLVNYGRYQKIYNVIVYSLAARSYLLVKKLIKKKDKKEY